MAETKTKPTKASPEAFIRKIANEQRRKDSHELVGLMQEITGAPPTMWGPSIIGFGKRRYAYASGREGEMPLTGFSPRKPSLVLYLGPGLADQKLLARLGKFTMGKGCLYIRKLDDVDRLVLRALIETSVELFRERNASD